MDKTLLKAYIRTLVEEEVNRILPKLLSEAVSEIRTLKESASAQPVKSKFSRSQLAEMMGLERIDDTIVARTGNIVQAPPGVSEDNPTVKAINKDYSAVMKKLGLT